jgi:tetratricopeptide (TPR) repeat protein
VDHGHGGAGKSVLAEEYALRFGAAYPAGVVWLRAFGHDDTRPDLSPEEGVQDRERQLAAIADSAGVAVKGLSASEIRTKLGERLDATGKYLWVVDDLPSDLSWQATQSWLAPSPNGHTLVTTRRRHESGQGLQVRVEELDEEDAYVLLTTRRAVETDEQQSAARRIVRALGLNPLGIELAAAAIAQEGYAEFAERLEQTTDDELEFAACLLGAAGESLPHREGGNLYLSRTLLASTRGLSEQAFDLLRLAAQVAVAPISRAVISRTFAAADGAEEPQARRADLAIVELISRSLGRAAGSGGIEIHTLVSRVVRFHHSAPDRMRKLRGGALFAFFDQFVVLGDAQTHPELANDSLHARRLIEACRTVPDADQAPAQAKLLGCLARFEAGLGRYADSRELYQEALELSRRVNGEAHSSTMAIAASFGYVLAVSGDFAAARALLERALQTAKDTYGDDSVVTLGIKENFAAMLLSTDGHQAAIPLLLEVVQARMQMPGADVADLLLTLNNLANAQLSAGNAQEAEKLIRTVVTARTQVLGPDHGHTLMSRNTLAGTLHNQGKTAEAIEILRTLVGDMARVLGATHPETLTVRSNLASLIKQRGDIDAAVRAQRELLELYRTSFGPTFPETIRASINLAESLTSAGQLSEAEELLKNAVAEAQALGQTHELTLLAAGNYAGVLQEQGRLDEARQLQQEVLRQASADQRREASCYADCVREPRDNDAAPARLGGRAYSV